MKDLILTLSIILCSGSSQASCSTWDILGGVFPEEIDGNTATLQDMQKAQQQTIDYIRKQEEVIDKCRMAAFQHNELIEDMQTVAQRYNRQLKIFQQHQQRQAQRN